MRQPNFNRNHGGPRPQAGFQKMDKQQRSTLLRLFRLVMKHYKWMVFTVLVCIAISSVTSLASTLFTRTLIDDYVVPLTQVSNPEYGSLLQALFKLGLILLLGVICSYTCFAISICAFCRRYCSSCASAVVHVLSFLAAATFFVAPSMAWSM